MPRYAPYVSTQKYYFTPRSVSLQLEVTMPAVEWPEFSVLQVISRCIWRFAKVLCGYYRTSHSHPPGISALAKVLFLTMNFTVVSE